MDYLQALLGESPVKPSAPAYRGIWVVAEARNHNLAAVTTEILGRAREMADSIGSRVSVVLLGHEIHRAADATITHGGDAVLIYDSPLLAPYRTETYVKVLTPLVQERRPEIVLLGATAQGRDLAPRLAARLRTGLLPECISLAIDEAERVLLGTRAVYGGLMWQTVACPTARPQIATVVPGALRALPPDPLRTGSVEQCSVDVNQQDLVTTVGSAAPLPHSTSLADARVVVGGGRGLGGPEGFALLCDLADVLHGVVAATRSAVELGWAERDRMVDMTGAHIHPELYIAVGVSGSLPHRLAIRGTRCLVAINTDAEAPIFRQANYGIVGDWRHVVPALIHALQEAAQQ